MSTTVIETSGLRAAADVLDRFADIDDTDAAVLAAEIRTVLDSAALALTRAREGAAAALARSGLSMSQVGAALNVSRQRAHQLVTAGMRQGWGETAGRADAGTDARAEYDAYLHAAYLAAEAATCGQLVRPEYRAGPAAVDPRRFFWRQGKPPMYAASEELLRYWRTGEFTCAQPDGLPLTFTAWQALTREPLPDTHA